MSEIKLLFFLKGEIILSEGKFFEKETTTQQRKIFSSAQKKKKENTKEDDDAFLKGQKTTRAMKMKRE